jgi:alanyl-tRNA synthetase
LKTRFAKVQKDILDEQKKKQKAESKVALDTVHKHFDENKDTKLFIGHLPISANPKAITDVMNHYKTKAKDKTIYLFGGTHSDDAVVHGVYVGTVRLPLFQQDDN